MREDVGLHVIDWHHGEAMRPRPRFGKGGANVQAAHQSRATRVRHSVQLIHLDSCGLEGRFQRGDDVLSMRPARQFRDNTAVLLVHGLVGYGIGQHFAASNDRNRCIITGGFNGEDNRRSWHGF